MSVSHAGSGTLLQKWLRARRAFLMAGTLLILPMLHFKARAASADAPAPTVAMERVVRSWQTEDGLPQDSVNAIVQTRDGFLWVGTNAGLARFDGVHFRAFGLQDGLRSVLISSLAEDRQGALWIGTSGGGVSRWEKGRFTSFGAEEGLPGGTEVIALAADRDGSVWIGTDKGLVQWSNGTFKIIDDAQGLPRNQVRALLHDSSGALWVSVITEGLFRGSNGHFTREERLGPEGRSVYSLMEDHDGAIWAGTNALWKWSGGVWKRFDSANGLPRSVIQALGQSRDGTLWVGARSNGLYRSTGGRFELAASAGPLATQGVRAVMSDREDSLWAGVVSGGLHRLSPRVLRYWGAEAGLPRTAVTSVAEDASGALFVGTADRSIQRFENGRFSPLADPVSANHFIIYCATTMSDGGVWVAGEQCLFRFQPGQPTKAHLDPPVRGEAIRAMCADGESLWLGTYYSTLLKCDSAGVRVVAPAGSFSGGISCLAREAAGKIWVGTSAGLHLWEHGEVRTWTMRDGLLSAYIRALHRDADGVLWIGTLGGGLSRMKNGCFVNITMREGLIDDVISQIVQDDFGALWLGCNRGIMRVERQELDALADGRISELHPLVFGRDEGMLQEQCFGGTSPTATKTRDGRLFFPMMGGLAEIDPRRLQNLATARPQVGIESFVVDNEPRALDGEISLPPGHHQLAVSYTAPVLRGGEWVRFRHRLEGLDDGWVATGGSRVASYSSLPAGRYVFHVAASDGKGNWNEPGASLAFIVRPFFWETIWFRSGVVILLVGSGAVVAWWRARHKHLLQVAELKQARQHQGELAHAGRVALLGELSASLAHELKQPLAAILSNAQAALRFLNHDTAEVNEMRDILKDIAASDRRAAEIIGRMQAMMKKGQVQLERRDLNADIEQVLLLIHGELVIRNVAVETQLPPDLPPIHGDHIQLQQVLLNLVINGCDAMNDSPPDERRLVIETARDGSDLVRVSVTDNGTGIAPEMLERIFEPFFSTKDSGLGMGLAVCRTIIKAHGGRLWAAKNPGRGATFHFTLAPGRHQQP